jgi:NADH dehydrogenase
MIVALTGATGFVGGAVLRRLLRREHQVRVLVRNPDRAGRLRDHGAVELVSGDLGDEAALRALVTGADAVVHLVGIIAPKGSQTFERVHVEGTAALAAAARAAGVRRFVHMSALGARADAAATAYHRTKAAGEDAVRQAVPLGHIILRPSLIAGPGSIPLRMMINMVRLAPVVPVIGDGLYRMQPVWLEDVAEAFALAVERGDLSGTFDIAGPESLTWHAMLDRIEEALGVRRRRVGVPLGFVRLGAAAGLVLPDLAPITPDQLQMLLEGSTTEANALATVFGVTPRPFALVVQEMCAPYTSGQTDRRQASDQTDRRQENGPGVAPRA